MVRMSMKNCAKALSRLEVGKGVMWVANRLRVHLTTIDRLIHNVQRLG